MFSFVRRHSVIFATISQICPLNSAKRVYTSAVALGSRGHIRISGNDSKKFLQGVCTVDINRYIQAAMAVMTRYCVINSVCWCRLNSDTKCIPGLFLAPKVIG